MGSVFVNGEEEMRAGQSEKPPSYVLRADRSPMNEKRWLVELSCGHEVWVTQATSPKAGKPLRCPKC